MKVLLIDDDLTLVEEWANELTALQIGLVPEPVESVEEFAESLDARRLAARNGGESEEPLSIDSAGFVVIDYDLGGVSHALTGRRLAYLARCFTTCGVIVLMNEHGENTFDLLLVADFDSFADVEIGSRQLANPHLWEGSRGDFRPWAWPHLLEEASRLNECAAALRDNPATPVLDIVGLGPVLELLPEDVSDVLLTGILGSRSRTEMTFELLRNTVLEGGHEQSAFLDRKDKALEETTDRIIAARLRRWLNRVIAPSQDLLVDAPYLVTRYPSLLGGDTGDLDGWNATTDLAEPESALDAEFVSNHAPLAGPWSDRPRWFWPLLQEDKGIAEVADPFKRRTTPFVFCEDLSAFVEKGNARPFSSSLRPPFTRRFVSKGHPGRYIKEVVFRPQSRFEE